MIRFFVVLLFLVFLSVQGFSQAKTVETYFLKNGLKVVLIKDNTVPITLASLVIKSGKDMDPTGLENMAHVVEHIMFIGPMKAYLTYRNTRALRATFAETRNHATFYNYNAMNNFQDKLLDLISQFFKDHKFSKKALDHGKRTVLQEKMANFQQAHNFSPTTGLGSTILPELKNINVSNAETWTNRWYVPNNAILVIMGNLNIEKVKKMINERFSIYSKKILPRDKNESYFKVTPRKGDTNQAYLDNYSCLKAFYLRNLKDIPDSCWKTLMINSVLTVQSGGNYLPFPMGFGKYSGFDIENAVSSKVLIVVKPKKVFNLFSTKKLTTAKLLTIPSKASIDSAISEISHMYAVFDSDPYLFIMTVASAESQGWSYKDLMKYRKTINSIKGNEVINYANKLR
jgi:hypothetical protein